MSLVKLARLYGLNPNSNQCFNWNHIQKMGRYWDDYIHLGIAEDYSHRRTNVIPIPEDAFYRNSESTNYKYRSNCSCLLAGDRNLGCQWQNAPTKAQLNFDRFGLYSDIARHYRIGRKYCEFLIQKRFDPRRK